MVYSCAAASSGALSSDGCESVGRPDAVTRTPVLSVRLQGNLSVKLDPAHLARQQDIALIHERLVSIVVAKHSPDIERKHARDIPVLDKEVEVVVACDAPSP